MKIARNMFGSNWPLNSPSWLIELDIVGKDLIHNQLKNVSLEKKTTFLLFFEMLDMNELTLLLIERISMKSKTIEWRRRTREMNFVKSILTIAFVYASSTRLYVTFSSFYRLYAFSCCFFFFLFLLCHWEEDEGEILSNIYISICTNCDVTSTERKISLYLTESIHWFESLAVHNRSSSIYIDTYIEQIKQKKKKKKWRMKGEEKFDGDKVRGRKSYGRVRFILLYRFDD